jgi:drug/metabolite transporter (DMT)-like permease
MAGDDRGGAPEEPAVDAEAQARFADLFDVRRIIGGLFLLYGAILFVLGLGASEEDVERAAGVNVNLWVGIGLLVVGSVFWAWALKRPLGR